MAFLAVLAMFLLIVPALLLACRRNRGASRRLGWLAGVTADGSPGCCTDRAADYGTVAPPHLVTDRSTRCAADRTTHDRATLRVIGATGKQQDDG